MRGWSKKLKKYWIEQWNFFLSGALITSPRPSSTSSADHFSLHKYRIRIKNESKLVRSSFDSSGDRQKKFLITFLNFRPQTPKWSLPSPLRVPQTPKRSSPAFSCDFCKQTIGLRRTLCKYFLKIRRRHNKNKSNASFFHFFSQRTTSAECKREFFFYNPLPFPSNLKHFKLNTFMLCVLKTKSGSQTNSELNKRQLFVPFFRQKIIQKSMIAPSF